MSFYDNSSLAFLPSSGAGKDGKAYSIKPTNGTGDFTFSRGSNLAATRVGPTGLIEKGRENLLLQSNQFDTTWLTTNASVTSGQSGYDGSSDAWSLTSTALNGSHRIIQTFTGGSNSIVTYSLFAKSNGYDFLRIVENASTGDFATFNLSNGSVINNTGIADTATISSVGNGWYRCSVSVDGGATTRFDIYTMETSGATDFLGDGVSGAYIQDAQVELGLAATDYIESGATTGKAGLLEDEPRFDYSGGATCPSLLLEPSRTNIVRQSEYIDGYGVKISCTSTPNYGTSPEGLTNSTRLQFTGNGYTYEAIPQVNGTQYTISVYAKRNDSGTQSFGFFVNGSGAIDSAMALTNEWKRFDYTYTATNNIYFGFAGNSGADVSVYGFQLEAASYPTSYIPNHSGGSVTRGKDECTGAGDSSTFNSTEGVLYAEINALKYPVDVNNWLTITDGTSANSVAIQFETNGTLSGRIEVGGVSQAYITTSVDYSNFIKVAFKYKENDFAWWVNGVEVGTDSSGITFPPNTLNSLQFAYGSGSNDWSGNVKQLLTFNTALSDADLATLTTL